MTLRSYISRIESILFSRRDLVIESWGVLLVGAGAKLEGIVCFEDGSKLFLTERLRPTGLRDPERSFFKYHYQRADGSLVFRYDQSPHYPMLATFPSHKHTHGGVVEAEPPDLMDVLSEIDIILYEHAER